MHPFPETVVGSCQKRSLKDESILYDSIELSMTRHPAIFKSSYVIFKKD